LILNENKRRE